METVQSRLLDEARREPVKNAFRLGLEFMDRNRMLAAMTMGVFFLLTLLELIPLLGLVAGVFLGVYTQSVSIYVGRAFYGAENIEGYVTEAETADFKTFLTRFQGPAFGAWAGWMTLSILMMLLFIVLFALSGIDFSSLDVDDIQNGDQAVQILMAAVEAGAPVLLLVLLFAYVYPIAQGRVILSETFGEAFKAVYSIFTPTVWAASMKKEYFSYMFFFSLALIGIFILVSVAMGLLILVPLLGMILTFVWTIFLMYVFMLILGVATVMAREIAEG